MGEEHNISEMDIELLISKLESIDKKLDIVVMIVILYAVVIFGILANFIIKGM